MNNSIKHLIKSFESKNNSCAENIPQSGRQIKKSNSENLPNIGESGKLSKILNKPLEKQNYDMTMLNCGGHDDDGSEKKIDKIISKFETYVKAVRAFSVKKMDNNSHLFYCCLLVGLDGRSPYIKSKFPSNVGIYLFI